ncbi:hypothetical protein [Terrarubrum flagellatum]|uniref:hypothetical protein n=1 Tax=Terrirubrum flagellatum TaxID=2895980 RepID=UPI0031452885
MNGRAAALFALAAILHGYGASAAEAFRQLNGREISAHLTGMELTDEVHWAFVFLQQSRFQSFSMGAKQAGTWRVRRNELCIERSNDAVRCYEVWMSGKQIQLRRPGLDIHDEGVLQRPAKRS